MNVSSRLASAGKRSGNSPFNNVVFSNLLEEGEILYPIPHRFKIQRRWGSSPAVALPEFVTDQGFMVGTGGIGKAF